jgi:glycerol kinase
LLVGLTRGTSRADLCKATLEGIAFEMQAAFAPLNRLVDCRRFVADGGATRSRRLMQFQADLLQTTVAVSARQEGTGFGAGFLAGLECGFWSGIEELRSLMPESIDYHPQIARDEARHLTCRWGQAAQRSLQWAQE